MANPSEFCVILTTVGNPDEADLLAEKLVKERLAACVQILQITSHYYWQDNLQREPEYLLMLKTRFALYGQVEAFIRKEHSYDLPEVIMLPVAAGLDSYLAWIKEHTVHST